MEVIEDGKIPLRRKRTMGFLQGQEFFSNSSDEICHFLCRKHVLFEEAGADADADEIDGILRGVDFGGFLLPPGNSIS